jgi:tetratricopeptide (TPR) repeat protein
MAKIALIAGKLEQVPVMHVFSRMASVHEIRIHAFLGSIPDSMRNCGFAFSLYEADPTRAGYMSGLEDQIADADLIVVAGPENLSSFQAMRSALKNNIHCHVISFDLVPQPFDDFVNIRAIRQDVLNRCQIIWTTGERSIEALTFEGYELQRIHNLPAIFDGESFPLDALRSNKFRDHVGISRNSFVVLFQDVLDHKGAAGELVKALHALRASGNPDFERLVVLFSGQREGSEPLKYMISDWRLSSHVRFLHQNSSEFTLDLLNGSDLVVGPCHGRSSEAHVLAAISSMVGARPLLNVSQTTGGWLDMPCLSVSEYTSLPLAKAIKNGLATSDSRLERRENFLKVISSADRQIDSQNFIDLIQRSTVKSASQSATAKDQYLEQQVATVESMGAGTSLDERLHAVEDLLLREPPPPLAARAHMFKGSALYAAGNYEAATDAYRAALLSMHGVPNGESSPQPRSLISSCYRGLGNVAAAVQSHQEALDLYRRALALEPQDSLTCAGIGNVYRRLRLYDESLHWLAKSALSMPGDESALTRFSQVLLECPEKPVAAKALIDVLQVVGEHPSLAKAMVSLDVRLD